MTSATGRGGVAGGVSARLSLTRVVPEDDDDMQKPFLSEMVFQMQQRELLCQRRGRDCSPGLSLSWAASCAAFGYVVASPPGVSRAVVIGVIGRGAVREQ